MSIKPKICGKNSITLPTSGCSDCAELEYRIKQLEDWKEEFVEEGYNALANKPTLNGVTIEGDKTSADYLIETIDLTDLEALTPMDCYEPPCQAPVVCTAEVCCAVLECDESEEEEIVPTETTEEEGE